MNTYKLILLYFSVVTIVGILLTVYDKIAAKAKIYRIPEKILMLTGFFGGALGMLITMLIIRHKTKHPKFMYGYPVFIILHILIISAAVYFMAK